MLLCQLFMKRSHSDWIEKIKFLNEKVLKKHKPASKNRNLVVILLDDGSKQEFNFAREIAEWMGSQDSPEELKEVNEIFAKVLTRAQVKARPDESKEAMKQEMKKFDDFDAFKVVPDEGQHAIKT